MPQNSPTMRATGVTSASPVYTPDNQSTIESYVKAVVQALLGAGKTGTAASGSTTTTINDTGRTEATSSLKGMLILFTSGANAGFWRRVTANTVNTSVAVANAFPSAPATGDTYVLVAGLDDPNLLIASQDSASNSVPAHGTGNKTDTPTASTAVAAAGSALSNGGLFAILKGLWNAAFKSQAITTYNSTTISVTTETDMLNVGAVGGTNHFAIEGAFINIASLGGAANVVIRLYVEINGASVLFASTTVTSTGTVSLSDLKTTATGAGNILSAIGITSRFLRVSYQFAATPTNASVQASFETMKSSA